MGDLRMFWWVYLFRAGFILLFAAILIAINQLLGTLIFDPILLVSLSLVIGFYIAGVGLLMGVAAEYAREHRSPIWRLFLAECVLALAIGAYVAICLLMTRTSLAMLGVLLTLSAGISMGTLAWQLRQHRSTSLLLAISASFAALYGILFVALRFEPTDKLTRWLYGFEILHGFVMLVFAMVLRGVRTGGRPGERRGGVSPDKTSPLGAAHPPVVVPIAQSAGLRGDKLAAAAIFERSSAPVVAWLNGTIH